MLDELIASSRERARRDAKLVSLRDLKRTVAGLPVAPRFEAALRYADRLALVAEVKRSSPSAGIFAGVGPGAAAAAGLARGYADAGATCLSILTEPLRFGGSDDDLRLAARVGPPALRKDFTVDPYQVWQARALGAAAVLLIVRALSDDALHALLEAAADAGVDALVEVHDEAELERALASDATLIGVNARDLGTLEVDLARGVRLMDMARSSGATLVAESGLRNGTDLRRAAEAGAHAALVGTVLLETEDPAARLRELVAAAPAREQRKGPALADTRVPPHPTRSRVKTCGVRDAAGVQATVRADSDLVGFVMAPDSPRAVDPASAGEMSRGLGRARGVLVFRSPSRADVDSARAASGVRGIQLAGFDRPPGWLPEVTARDGTPSRMDPVIGVVHQPSSVRAALLAAEDWYAAGATDVLLEAAPREVGGGARGEAPVEIARRVGRIVPIGIAGGLEPANVAAAVARARPALVDAASGLERGGRSDPPRIASFVRAARRDPLGADRVDSHGRFGPFGGRYVPETLVPALEELEAAWRGARADRTYVAELERLRRDFIGRPTALFEVPARALATGRGDAVRLFLKREDLAHTGAHKINNAVGQALLARQMGKRRVIAETGAGQHGVAAASACALLGLECVVYMGTTDMERQAPNVERMRLLGADVRAVSTGNGTLRDALNEALRDWVTNVETTYYILGSAAGPHPYPEMVADLQSVIGREARSQILAAAGRLPDIAIACVGGGSNAIGLFRAFLDSGARLVAVEAGGRGDGLGDNAASLGLGSPGVLHGAFTMLTQT
ncbi:MAG: tryptophan synthase subunit beta, partial [Chloroflexi bacterium]|nr:tryptophan synthase subunit beta [Chloroflexota bacterium]